MSEPNIRDITEEARRDIAEARRDIAESHRDKLLWTVVIIESLVILLWMTFSVFALRSIQKEDMSHVYQIGHGAYSSSEAARDLFVRDRAILELSNRITVLENKQHIKPVVVVPVKTLQKLLTETPVIPPKTHHWWNFVTGGNQ